MIICLSVCVFTRQEDQKLFLTLLGLNQLRTMASSQLTNLLICAHFCSFLKDVNFLDELKLAIALWIVPRLML